MRERPRIAWFAAAVALAVVSLAAQQEPTFRTKTQLVRVDAAVVDADGNPVRGLTADDFTLIDRGQPQKIATFEEIHHEAPKTARPLGHRDVADNRVDDTSEIMVLVLDDFHIRKEWTDHARQIVEDFVNDLGDDVMIAMVSTTGKHDVELTTDRTRILDALKGFSGSELKLEYSAGGNINLPGTPSGSPGLTAEEAERYHVSFGPLQPPVEIANMNPCLGALIGTPYDSSQLFHSLEHAAQILGTDDRRHKALAWISTGESFASEGLSTAVAAMRQSGVATYAIDPVGTAHVIPAGEYGRKLCPKFGVLPTPWQMVADNKHSSLTATARGSGGIAVINDDDFAGGVKRIVTDFGDYYTLGFYPDDVTTAGVRPLDVKVNRPGVSVRARMSYALMAAATEKPKDPLVAAAGALVPTGDLPLRMYAAALPSAAHDARVVVALEVTEPTSALEPRAGAVADQLKYDLFAIDLKKGTVAQTTKHGANVELRASGGATPEHVTYTVETSLTLPPGRYQLRASASSDRVGTSGTVYLPLDVPDFSDAPIVLTDLILGDSRVPVAKGEAYLAFEHAQPIGFAPTLDRDFTRDTVLHLYAEMVTKTSKTPIDATVTIADANDRAVWSDHRTLTAADHARATLDLNVPLTSVPPGSYVLRVAAASGANTVKREIGIVVR